MTDAPNLPPTDEIPEAFIPPNRDPRWAALAAPFPADEIEKLPKQLKKGDQDRYQCKPGAGARASADGFYCGGYHARSIHLDYVGHAGVTTRLNSVDPTWTWEPMYRDVPHDILLAAISTGNEAIVRQVIDNAPMLFTQGGLWINLTVLGVTRPGFGDAAGKSGPDAVKELIGDALRNAGMRFGIATYLWSKSTKARAAHPEAEDDDAPALAGVVGVDGSVEETAAQRTMRQRREADQLRYGQLADAADRALGGRVQAVREQLDQLTGRNVAGQQAGPAIHGDDDGHASDALARQLTGRAQHVNGHAAGQLPPPADDEPVHVAGARAVQRIKEQREAEREAERRQRQQQGRPDEAEQRAALERLRREPERPAPRPAPAGDPETAALVEAITRATTPEQIARLWAQSVSVRPQGRMTDVRGYVENLDVVAAILGRIFAEIKVDPAVAIPVGALVVAAGRHLDDPEGGMSIHDHVGAETADINPATGQAVNPPADAVAPTR